MGVIVAIAACLLAVTLVGSSPVGADGHAAPPPEDELVQVGTEGNVHLWEPAFRTLRSNARKAAVSIPNADWRVRSPDGMEASLNRDPLPVYDGGDTVELEFDEVRGNAGGTFGDEHIHVLRAHVDDSSTGSTSFTDVIDLLSSDRSDASYSLVSSTTLDDGSVTVSDDPYEPGNYVYFAAAANETSLALEDGDIEDGDFATDTNVTIVGLERINVRKGTGVVSAPDAIEPGKTVPFDVDASGLNGGEVAQSIVLYDESTYVDQYLLLDLTQDIDEDFDLQSDSLVETSLDDVSGVSIRHGGLGRIGASVDDGFSPRLSGIPTIFGLVAHGVESDLENVDSTGGDVLQGSVSSTQGSPRETSLALGTEEDWDEGEYRWIYVAAGNATSERYVQTGTTWLLESEEEEETEEEETETGGSEGSNDEDVNESFCESQPDPSLAVSGNTVTGTVDCIEEGSDVGLELGLTASDGPREVTFERFNVTAANAARDVYANLSGSTALPDDAPAKPDGYRTLGYLSVGFENLTDSSSGTVTFEVPNSTLADVDVDREAVTFLRLADGEWETVETTHVEGSRFQADAAGFSTFAVGVEFADLDLTHASLTATEVPIGDPVEVSARVRNNGSRVGTTSVEVTANEQLRETAEISVEGGETITETIPVTFEAPGNYTMAVDDIEAGTVNVTDPANETGGPEELAGGAALPLLVVVVVSVIGILAAEIYYRG